MKAVAALAIPVALLVWMAWPRGASDGPGACDAVAAADLAAVLGHPVERGRTGPAEGTRRDATVCNRRDGTTVFALTGGARRFYERAVPPDADDVGPEASVMHDVFGDGRTDSVWLLRGDTYVNVLLRDAPEGAADALAARLVGYAGSLRSDALLMQ